MSAFSRRPAIGLLSVFALALAACGGSGSGIEDQPDPTPDPAPPSTGTTGTFNLSISDGPIKDATKVCVRFDGVELKAADSDDRVHIDFDQPEVVNLLANQGANSHPIITGAEVPAGVYEWIRLKVVAERGLSGGANDGDPTSEACDDETEGSYLVRESGGVYNLFIREWLAAWPAADQGNNHPGQPFRATTRLNGISARSFNGPPGLLPDVMMKPVVKLVANNEVGTLVGQVDDELIALDSCDADFAPSVYVFDDGVTPNPFDDPFADDDAVATGLVEQQMQDDGSMPMAVLDRILARGQL